MKFIVAILVALLILLHYKLWIAPNGVRQMVHLRHVVAQQQKERTKLHQHNITLLRRVARLKRGKYAVEPLAREDLGMVRQGEVYYQFVKRGEKDENISQQ